MNLVFSRRTSWPHEHNAISSAIARHNATKPLLDLTLSNPTVAGIEYPQELFEELGSRSSSVYAPDARGLREARTGIAETFGLNPARLIVTASTSEAYSFLFKLLCDPGDRILTPRPSYPLFEHLAELESVTVANYLLFYDHGWHYDISSLEDAITPDTRAVVVVNPNNPTGSFLKKPELSELHRICSQRQIAIISDEVFWSYGHADVPEQASAGSQAGDVLTFTLNGLSKYAGLPQLKLGWIAVDGTERLVNEALRRLELIADTYLSVGTPVQLAAPKLLQYGASINAQIKERVRSNWVSLGDALAGSPIKLLAAEGGWQAIVQVPATMSEEEWVLTLLEQRGVLVQPGYFYDFTSEAYLVLSLLPPAEVFGSGVSKLIEHVQELAG